MPNKLLYLLWCAVFLAQCCQYAQASKESSSSEESNEQRMSMHSSEFKKLTPRLQLLISVLSGSEPLHARAVADAAIALQKVLDDIALLKAPSANLKVHVDRISQYLQEVDQVKELAKARHEAKAPQPKKLLSDIVLGALKLSSDLVVLAEQYNTSDEHSAAPTIEELLVRLSLEKNGFAKLWQKFGADFTTFKSAFIVEMDEYVAKLPAAERENQAKMIDCYKQFKQEPRIQRLYEFFSFFTEEDMQTAAKFIFK